MTPSAAFAIGTRVWYRADFRHSEFGPFGASPGIVSVVHEPLHGTTVYYRFDDTRPREHPDPRRRRSKDGFIWTPEWMLTEESP